MANRTRAELESLVLEYTEGSIDPARKALFEEDMSKDAQLRSLVDDYKLIIKLEGGLRAETYPASARATLKLMDAVEKDSARSLSGWIGQLMHSKPLLAGLSVAALALILVIRPPQPENGSGHKASAGGVKTAPRPDWVPFPPLQVDELYPPDNVSAFQRRAQPVLGSFLTSLFAPFPAGTGSQLAVSSEVLQLRQKTRYLLRISLTPRERTTDVELSLKFNNQAVRRFIPIGVVEQNIETSSQPFTYLRAPALNANQQVSALLVVEAPMADDRGSKEILSGRVSYLTSGKGSEEQFVITFSDVVEENMASSGLRSLLEILWPGIYSNSASYEEFREQLENIK